MTQTPTAVSESRMLIGGELVDAASGKTFDNVNPATEETIGQVADADATDMQRAIDAARTAFDSTDWSTNRPFRIRCLQQLQAALESEREELRTELVAESGSPVMLTYGGQIDGPIDDNIQWPIKMIGEFAWERELPPATLYGVNSGRRVWKEAMGVVGAIVPWNFPFDLATLKIGQILATGNAMILKPAPDTPFNATRIGRLIAAKTDIPPGVFNVVTSSDHLVGEELTLSPKVDMISFTGSSATGKRIVEKGAPTMKRVVLELGGKSAGVFLDDADLAAALPQAGMASCTHGGQFCANQSRILVPRARLEEATALLAEAMKNVPYGDPTDPNMMMGPQISAKQRQRVLDYIDIGKSEGAELVLGGGKPPHLPKGWFVEPTLFTNVDNAMRIAQEEIFGPVLCVIPYDDEDHAAKIANDSQYGLSGGVVSASQDRAFEFARKLRTGTVGINGGIFYAPDAPYGGYKSSGIGRQGGPEGFDTYLETKTVAWNLS
ncbi:aldehyde dehydrogenase family protein [Mycobacterium sp. 94-17]|uniref:aldehyde dehydrogenase family protein n=1 Tax=Mycobacterium sp. 94-17 TaxID=2986147 RepID=UPI002D1F9844|nr:aldehyde dehydrogenase family protein [Mycobacterium sp. 94-17]MEB4209760.1 aldehyde dehydrogenase family protein [Mycobacterium sp. 94-17]